MEDADIRLVGREPGLEKEEGDGEGGGGGWDGDFVVEVIGVGVTVGSVDGLPGSGDGEG